MLPVDGYIVSWVVDDMDHESIAFSNVYSWTGKTSVNSRYHLLLAQRFHHHVFNLLSDAVNIVPSYFKELHVKLSLFLYHI